MNQNSFYFLIFATIATFVMSLFPAISFLIYPIELFGTFVHELSHALAAILTGGQVHSIAINPDTSGTTITSGGIQWLISFAGYLGTVLFGLLCIFLMSRDKPKIILLLFSCVSIFLVGLTGAQSLYGTVWGLVLAFSFYLLVVSKVHKSVLAFLISFISLQLLLNAFYDLKTLFILSGTGIHTDAVNMQHATGIPSVFWAGAWILLSFYATYRASLLILKGKQNVN